MRQVTAFLLLATLTFPFIMRVGVVGHYFANKNYYETVLCINKDNVEMHCEGNCQLQQELKNISEPAPLQKGQLPHSVKKEVSPYIVYGLLSLMPPDAGNEVRFYKILPGKAILAAGPDFFHPPELV